MKKSILLFVFVCLANLLFSSSVFAQTPPPTGTTTYYYCIGDSASQLTAGGTNLLWYTAATGGTGSSTAPTPSTVIAGSTSYYVTQTIGGVVSTPRKQITVNVDKQFSLVCGPSTTSSVNFDFAHVGETSYDYSYVINGGGSFSGTLPGSAGSYTVNVLEGQSVTFTITAVGARSCVRNPTLTTTCTALCSSPRAVPNFTQIPPICEGTTPAPTLGATSPNGISGTWSPAVINTNTPGTVAYTFTPNPATFPCANTQTMNITVVPKATPVFNSIPATVCQNATVTLPLNSDNATPISGTWTPGTVNTTILGPVIYTFTPNAGQCVVTTLTTKTITVMPNVVNPGFAAIAPICVGSNPPVLNTTSPSGVTGTWSPLMINTNSLGTASYTFTPNPNQCSNPQTLSVTVIAKTVPNFAQIPAFCAGSTSPTLASTSPNGVSGTWSPSLVNSNTSGSYIFTPNSNECATTQTMNITVNAPTNPGFSDFSICSGNGAPTLDTTSPSGITGSWNPGTVDDMNSDSYTFTPDPGQCAISQTINVTVMPSNMLVDFDWTVSEAFAENQKITISAITAGGDYLYQLDDGPLQSSPVFEYVASGTHSVTVTDQTGCSMPITKTGIMVVNYPKFFTPNNDGYNDYWNIAELSAQTFAYIRIFDRYGKFLKQISPNGSGWNGTYNGHYVPADDYWFVIHYSENNIVKEFRSHFTLKR